jgi:hypothetical protein
MATKPNSTEETTELSAWRRLELAVVERPTARWAIAVLLSGVVIVSVVLLAFG